MSYKIVQVDTQSVALFARFQIQTVKQVRSFSFLEDLNNRPPAPVSKKSLEYAAEIGMLYAAVAPERNRSGTILGFMIGHSPGAAIGNKEMQFLFRMLQEPLQSQYILLIQSLFKPGIDQQEMFIAMLGHLLIRARFFEFEHVVFPVRGNQYLERFLCSCTDLDLACDISKKKVTFFKSTVLKK